MKTLKTNTIVWVDVDDVLVKFRKMFNIFLNQKYGLSLSEDYLAHDWSYKEVLPKDANFMDYFNSLPKNWTEDQEVYPRVKQYLNEIKNMGHHIILITAVPEHAVHFRLKNLISHGLYFDEIYFTSQDKSLYSREILKKFNNWETVENVFIDDRAKNCVDLLNNMPNMKKIVSLNAPFNNKEMSLHNSISYHESTEAMWEELMKYLKSGDE